MEHRPPRALGTALGASFALWSVALVGLLISKGLTQPVSLSALGPYLLAALFFALACLFGYWTFGCWTLRYVLSRNGLAIRWGAIRQIIPLDQIERIVPGRQAPEPAVEGISWMGHHVGRARVPRLGEALFYSTHRSRDELVYVVTPDHAYALSVGDHAAFAAALEHVRQEGASLALPHAPERRTLAAQPFWSDHLAQILAAAAVLACAVVFGYIFARYPGLPDTLPLSFPSIGGVSRVAPKSDLLALPLTALGVLLVNLVLAVALHTWERMAGYLLLVAAVGLQATFLVGAIAALA